MHKIIVATNNKKKVIEITDIIKKRNINNLSFCYSKDYNLDSPLEDGTTFKQNALIKAKYAASKTNLISMSDDSGLCVENIGNQPGVYSADWIEEHTLKGAIDNIYSLLGNKEKSAKFVSTICIYFPADIKEKLKLSQDYYFFEGEIKGELIDIPPSDLSGFAYDNIFIPNNSKNKQNKTFSMLPIVIKNEISHRVNALNRALLFLSEL